MPEAALVEYRTYSLLESKSDDNGKFSGYAATYKKDAYGDIITQGAFAASITKRGAIPILLNHDPDKWIGVSTSLEEDAKGLYIEGMLSMKSSLASDAYAVIQTAHAANFKVGLSIGFIAEEYDLDDEMHRTLNKIDLWETSITPFPANKGARIDSLKSLRTLEQILRDVGGCSKEAAKRVLAMLPPYLLADASGNQPNVERDARTLRPPISGTLRAALEEFNASH